MPQPPPSIEGFPIAQAPPGKKVVISEVDVRIVNGGVYVPCRSCHWHGICAVPQASFLRKSREYFANSDIHYNNTEETVASINNTVFHCIDYTIITSK